MITLKYPKHVFAKEIKESQYHEKTYHEKTIKAIFQAVELIIINLPPEFKENFPEQLSKTIIEVLPKLTLNYESYNANKPVAMSPDEDVATRGRCVLIASLESTATLIRRLTTAFKEYIENIEQNKIVLLRTHFLPILESMAKIEVPHPSDISLLGLELPDSGFNYLRTQLENSFIILAKRQPINVVCPITKEPIDGTHAVYIPTGHQFNFLALLNWQCTRDLRQDLDETPNLKKLINPFTNKPFNKTELKSIKIKSILLSISLSFDKTFSFDPIILAKSLAKPYDEFIKMKKKEESAKKIQSWFRRNRDGRAGFVMVFKENKAEQNNEPGQKSNPDTSCLIM